MVKLNIKWKLISTGLCLIIIPLLILGVFTYNRVHLGVVEMVAYSIRKQVGNWKTIVYSSVKEVEAYKQSTPQMGADYEEKQKEALKNIISKEVIGKTGYIYVLDSRGAYVVSKDRKRDGENIWESKDAAGNLFIQEIVKKAKKSVGAKVFPIQYYPWTNLGETAARLKFAALTYVPEWDWIIGVSAYQDEFFDQLYAVRNASVLIGAFSIIIGVVILLFSVRAITMPIRQLHYATNRIVGGDLGFKIERKGSPHCWEISREGKKCNKTDCPAYGREDLPCWYIAGTFCKSSVQADSAEKMGNCQQCVIYKDYAGDEIQQLSDSFNMMTAALKESYTGLEEKVKMRTAELEDAKLHLEDKVKERTAELTRGQTAMLYMVEDLNRQAKELKEAQDKVVRFEKMAVVGQLASSVAHELRNPLGVMKNAIYYMNMLGLGKDNPDIKENLEIISTEIENSDKVISDLLEFSRIKQPALNSEDINVIVTETLNRVKAPVGIKIVTELGEDLPQMQVDAVQLQQVFYNIAQNAVQAMTEGGVLTVSSGITRDETIAIAFRDTGCGILKENLQKIFEPLFSTKMKGTGLGLSVVASLVEGHGGTIEVESEIQKGSTFTVKLPITKG